MKIIKADNYEIQIGEEFLSRFDMSDYSTIAILVDENTKRDCLPILLDKIKRLNLMI